MIFRRRRHREEPERLLRISEVAQVLDISPRQVLALGEDGAIEVREGKATASSVERLKGKLVRQPEGKTVPATMRVEHFREE